MLRSAVTALSRTLLRLAASSARPSVFHPPLASASSSGPILQFLPSASVPRFPFDFCRGYARGRPALSASEDDVVDDDDDDDDDDVGDDSDDTGMGSDKDFDDDDEEIDSDEFSD